MEEQAKTAPEGGGPTVRVLHARDNAGWARVLRELADRVEESPEAIGAYAAVVVYEDGSVGHEYHTVRHAPLVGALELIKQRVIHEWTHR